MFGKYIMDFTKKYLKYKSKIDNLEKYVASIQNYNTNTLANVQSGGVVNLDTERDTKITKKVIKRWKEENGECLQQTNCVYACIFILRRPILNDHTHNGNDNLVRAEFAYYLHIGITSNGESISDAIYKKCMNIMLQA